MWALPLDKFATPAGLPRFLGAETESSLSVSLIIFGFLTDFVPKL